MIRALLHIVANSVGLYLADRLVPGIHYNGTLGYLLLAGLVIGVINLLVKPIVSFFSFPLIFLTLGLFYLVINGLMLYLAAYFLRGLSIDGCVPAILGGLIIAVLNWIVGGLVPDRR